MRKFSLLVLAFTLAACSTSSGNGSGGGFNENQTPEIRSYPQDVDQCLNQPEVIWCVKACEVDPEYEWCEIDE